MKDLNEAENDISKTIHEEQKALRQRHVSQRENDEESKESKPEIVALRRELGITSCVGILVGNMIGAGIFISPKGVFIGSGSVGLTLVIWIAAGFFSFLGALCYVELGTLLPCSGGSYMYYLECFAPTRRRERLFWGPLLAFFLSWQSVLLWVPASFAIQALAIAKYLLRLDTIGCTIESRKEIPEFQTKLLALVIMLTVIVINSCAVKVSTRLINVFTFAKTFSLAFIIAAGGLRLSQGHTETLDTGFEGTNWSYGGISMAFYSALYAFAGWSNLNMVTREMKNPKRDFLPAVVLSMALVTALYVLANVSYFTFMTTEELMQSDEVAVDVSSRFFGVYGVWIMVFCVACSVYGSTTGAMFANIRLAYAAAREGHMMEVLSYLSIKYMTPVPALVFTMIISVFLVWNSSILGLILAITFVAKFFDCISMIVLLVMRRTKKNVERVINVPTFVPVLVFLFNVSLIVTPLIENARVEYSYGIVVMLLGLIVYIPFVYYQLRIPKIDTFVAIIQKILLVAPPEDDEI